MKLGIVGNGVIVQEILTFIDEIGFDEIYICGSEDKLNALASKFHLNQVFTDYDKLLSSDVDVVYIGLLNDMHFEYALKALKAKKHVLCEKPMCVTLEEVNQLENAARENGVMLIARCLEDIRLSMKAVRHLPFSQLNMPVAV